MSDDTLPPRKPNTLRTWLPRLWHGATAKVSANPDWALALFLLLLAVAIIL